MKISINRNLALLLSGQLVSQVGDKFYLLALSYWVLKSTESPAMMGLVLASALIPSLLVGFVSGAFIDRYNRKTIIVMADVIRGLIISFIGVAYIMDFLDFSMIIVSQVLLSVCAGFFDPAIPAIIPRIVAKEELSKANAKTQFIQGISSIAGPVMGGIAVAGFGYSFAFLFNGVSFLVSAFFELFMQLPSPASKREPNTVFSKGDRTTVKHEILEGYRYILSDGYLKIILLTVAVIHFFVGAIEVIIPVLAESLVGNGALNMGYMQAAFGVGAVIMAMVISFYSIDNKEERYLFSGIFMVGSFYVLMAVMHVLGLESGVPFFLVFLLMGASIILAGTCFKSILQKRIDDGMEGRVFGVVSSIGNGSIPFAMLIYGFLLTWVDVYGLLLVSGVVLMPVSIISYHKLMGGENKKDRAAIFSTGDRAADRG